MGERLAIEPFKERYRSEVLRERRVTLVKREIMVAYFNYLDSQNEAPRTPDELKVKTKFLVNWIANNWRPRGRPDVAGLKINVRAIDVVWRSRKDECEEVLKEMLGVEELDRSGREYFEKHKAAAKVVLDGLSAAEKEKLDAEVLKIKEKGHDRETQRELAQKHAEKRITTFAKERWLEMGMLTLTVAAYTLPNGQLAVTCHDEMAPMMNVNFRSFRDKYKDTVDNLKRNILQYVKNLQEVAGEREIEEVGQDEAAQIKMTASGLPILPDPSAWRSRCKKDLEPLIRMYLKQHYKAASAGWGKHVPFGALKRNARQLIERKYMPRLDILQDPRNMQKEDIIDFLNHVHARQETHGIEEAFRFSHYLAGNNELHTAKYPSVDDDGDATKKRRGRKKSGKGDNGRADTEHRLPMPTTNEHTARTSDTDDRLPEPHANENPLSNERPSLFGTWTTSGDGIYEQTERDNIIGDSGDMPIPPPVGQNDDTPISTPVVQNLETQIPNLVIDPALLQGTVNVTNTQTNAVKEGDDDDMTCKPSEGRNKRKRMQTADDLAAAEASKYGASRDERRQPRPRMVTRTANELAAAEASKYSTSSDQRRQPRPRKVTRTADELAAAEALMYGASSNQRRQPRPPKIT